MKPTLLILAAGMGSRYGNLKQLDTVGPSKETIIDYSVYDSIRAGFGKVVFVIRKSFEKQFRDEIVSKFEGRIATEIVFQEISSVPPGSKYNLEREKPWGTNHALLMAKEVINEPFGVINADDFYGQESFETLAKFLKNMSKDNHNYCMVAYRLQNTLSKNGSVSRGQCYVDHNNLLTNVVERTNILSNNGKITYRDEENNEVEIDGNTPVSMNFWGFSPNYFELSEKRFVEFLSKEGENPKSEFYIPTMVNSLIETNVATCEVIQTTSSWFGVTYKEDKQNVVDRIKKLVEQNKYPADLWKAKVD